MNPPYLGRLWRDRSFAHAIRDIVSKSATTLVQSHERIDCCDVYRAGDGLHSVWLDERLADSTSLERLRVRASPYHRYVLDAERRLFESARLKVVICISQMVQNDIRERFGLAVERLPIIYNAIDPEEFGPQLSVTRAATRASLNIDESRVVFLLIGSGYERKGAGRAIEALAGVPEQAHLVIVGHDREPARYRRLAERLGVAKRVTFTGPQADPRPFYGAADVFVLPTLYDPLSNAVLEAMACGLPVITSNRCGAGELVTAHHAGFVCGARDIAGLGDAMRALLMPAARTCAAANAICEFSKLTPAAMTAQLLDVYQQLLDGRGAAR